MKSIWDFKTYDEQQAQLISRELDISMICARLLVQRGISSPDEARYFLNPDINRLTDPSLMAGMSAAVERILRALHNQESIVIYGDYDVDGICSVVIMKECLGILGCNADYYVPNRFNEGYGLNKEAIQELAGQNYNLIITVDCGISAVEEAELARQLGMDLIITDHHTPPAIQPQAAAVINPKNDNLPALRDLAGVGVAYKLACALLQAANTEVGSQWLDLVALATVADIVPLIAENRILIKHGLQALEDTQRTGLKALMQKTSLQGKKLETWHIGFVLAPRLNSAGRLNSASTSIELLVCQNDAEADRLAEQLCAWNDERRSIEEDIFQQALKDVEINTIPANEPFIITGGEGWHEGVIGIVASRLTNKFNRPAIVISWDGERGKGSGRSCADVDLYEALTCCRDSLEQFGGHKMAAGLSIKRDCLPLLKKSIRDYMAKEEKPDLGLKRYPADMEIENAEINQNLLKEITLLSPFGEGNPVPNFVLRASPLFDPGLVGAQGDHFKCKIGSSFLEGIAFNRSDFMAPIIHTCNQDLLFELGENTFRGRTNLQIKIKDMKSSFYPDYRSDLNSNSAEIVRAIHKTAEELAVGQPVLFVYPGYRSLTKHASLMHRLFKMEQVLELHGLLNLKTREIVQKQFISGTGKLFLTTRSFLEYHCRNYSLPSGLRYAFFLWSGEENPVGALQASGVEIGIIRNNHPEFVKCSPEWDFSRPDRTVVYANRPATIKSLGQARDLVEVESGLADSIQRGGVRQRFIKAAQGMLLVDGTHPSCVAPIGKIDNFILADSPFGYYELGAVADYGSIDLPLRVSFARSDLDKNRLYLERVYPEVEQVAEIWRQMNRYGESIPRCSEEQLAARLKADLKRDLRPLDLAPVLSILADLGLCQFQKSGSIIEIKQIKNNSAEIDINNSPYYLEGLGEKGLFADWEQSINNNLVW